MSGYGQFCPVAKTMEVLDERWTVLIIREMLAGSRHFNEIRRGVPRMSPALLSKRLRTLSRAGIIVRTDEGGRAVYDLSRAGRELEPIVVGLGEWGIRWRTQLGDEDLDPHLLMWDIHRNLDHDALPPTRTTLAFHLRDVERRTRDWWLVAHDGTVDLCDFDPGYEVAVSVDATLVALFRLWRGDVSWRAVLEDGSVVVNGTTTARRAFPRWLKLSQFASVPRVPSSELHQPVK